MKTYIILQPYQTAYVITDRKLKINGTPLKKVRVPLIEGNTITFIDAFEYNNHILMEVDHESSGNMS